MTVTPEERSKAEQAAKVANDYLCARCWGNLTAVFVDRQHTVKCFTCNELASTTGVVSQHFVAKQIEQQQDDLLSIDRDVRRAITGNPHAGKTADQLIKELGFD